MNRILFCLLCLVLVVSQTVQKAELPVGYIIRTTAKGSVQLLRGVQGKAASGRTADSITVAALKKRVYVYNGDRFQLAEGADVWYFAGNQVKQGSHTPIVEDHPEQEGSRWLRGYRPLDGSPPTQAAANAPPSFLFGNRRDNNLYVPMHGPLGIVWYHPTGYTARTLTVIQGSTRLSSETIPAAAAASTVPVGLYLSKALAEQLLPLARNPNGADVLLRLTFAQVGPGKKSVEITQGFHIVPTAQCQQADYAEEQWREADAEDQFVRLSDYMLEMERLKCGMEGAARVAEWWSSEPDNYAAKAAMHALALRSECVPLERFFRSDEK